MPYLKFRKMFRPPSFDISGRSFSQPKKPESVLMWRFTVFIVMVLGRSSCGASATDRTISGIVRVSLDDLPWLRGMLSRARLKATASSRV